MNQQSIQHHLATTTATLVPDKPAPARARHVFKLGLDVDMHFAVTAIQCDHGTIKPAQKLTRPQLLKWVREQVAAGHTVHTVYEACGFGYRNNDPKAITVDGRVGFTGVRAKRCVARVVVSE